MEVRSDGNCCYYQQMRSENNNSSVVVTVMPLIERTRLKVWFIRVCTSIVLWTCLVHLVAVAELFRPHLVAKSSSSSSSQIPPTVLAYVPLSPPPPPCVPPRNYTSNGFLRVTCNGGLNQMRAAICDMVTVARFLNLTLVVPELDKTSFWADTSDFEDIFDVKHFIDSLRDEVRIIRRLPKRFNRKYGFQPLVMQPISWSNEKYYIQQVLPLFEKNKVIHFNKTDTRLANNGLPVEFQRLRCRVNFEALKFTSKIQALGEKLVRLLQAKGPFVSLHLRYEMDMLAFSGCNHGCTEEEAEDLKQMRYAYPWWRDKEINSEEKRSQGLCPLTPEETTLILQPWVSIITPRYILHLEKFMVVKEDLQLCGLHFLIQLRRICCWTQMICGSSGIILLKWQPWIFWFQLPVTYLFQRMMETWQGWLKVIAGILVSRNPFYWIERGLLNWLIYIRMGHFHGITLLLLSRMRMCID